MKKLFIVLLIFAKIATVFGQNDNTLIPYRLKNKWGYCDVNGNIKIKPVFEKVELFNKDGYAIVKQSGKFGIIDINGKTKIKPIFEYIGLYNEDGHAIVKQSGKFGIIDTNGIYTCTPQFKELYAGGSFYGKPIYYASNEMYSGKYEFPVNYKGQRIAYPDNIHEEKQINEFFINNKIKTKHNFNLDTNFIERFYFLMKNDTFIYCINNKNQHGILSKNNIIIVPIEFWRISEYDGLFMAKNKYTNGLYTKKGELILETKFIILNKKNFRLILSTENFDKQSVYDIKTSKFIIPPNYKKIILLDNFSYLVSNIHWNPDDLDFGGYRAYTLVNELNKPITDTIFKQIMFRGNQDSNFFFAQTSEGWNKFNLLGKKMYKESYNKLIYTSQNNGSNKTNFKDDFFIVSKFINIVEEKYGVINIDDSIHIPFEFDEIEVCSFKSDLQGFFLKNHYFKNNMLLAKNDNKCGLITIENKIVVPLIYKNIELLENTPFAFVELENGNTGFINFNTGVEYYKD